MRPLFNSSLIAVALLLGVSSFGPAQAATTTYQFSGNCQDCAEVADSSTYPVTAELVLDNYTPGSSIQFSNFVSFTYGGSNLLGSYTVVTGGQPLLSSVPTLPTSLPTFYLGMIGGQISPTLNVDTLSLSFDAGQIGVGSFSAQVLFLGSGYFNLFAGGGWDTCASESVLCFADMDTGNQGRFIAPTVSVPVTAPLGLLLAGGLAAVGLRRRR